MKARAAKNKWHWRNKKAEQFPHARARGNRGDKGARSLENTDGHEDSYLGGDEASAMAIGRCIS